jgi:hypothetical protein
MKGRREPTVEDQFSVLLSVLVGHSLKDNARLWERLVNLRDARNSFVHTGVCRMVAITRPLLAIALLS